MVLKGIPSVISPELMHALMSMGHGDEIVIADGNFPAASTAKILIRADGIDAVTMLEAILKFLPIDDYADDHAVVMQVVPGDNVVPVIWNKFEQALKLAEGDRFKLTQLERFAFYERSKKAYAIIATSESAQYANIILKKGVVRQK